MWKKIILKSLRKNKIFIYFTLIKLTFPMVFFPMRDVADFEGVFWSSKILYRLVSRQ
jgi:hypothetical protein